MLFPEGNGTYPSPLPSREAGFETASNERVKACPEG
jgi:hypothetical protein